MRGQLRIAYCAGLVVGTMTFGMISPALAEDSNIWTKAAPQAADWYYYGAMETGGRFVIDRPPSGFGTTSASSNGLCPVPGTGVATSCFLTPAQTQSRAKFEEYGDVLSNPFLDWINLQAGTKDGRFSFDFWARNVGLNNQNYNLTLSRPGQDYFTFEWDQTPHLISTSGKTVFGGVGSTFLTINPALPPSADDLAAAPGDAKARANIQALINAAEMPLTLGTQRDRATVGYRATPTPDWDFRAEYSHEDRTGVVPASIGHFFDTTGPPAAFHYPIGIPKPIDDTTQSVEANGERSDINFLGMRWTTSVVYNGSFYHNNLTELDAQNPFCTQGASSNCSPFTPTLTTPFVAPTMLRLGLDPSNEANAVTWNTAVDIPFWKSRYVSTVQYNDMRQNDPFINTSINGLVAPPVTLNGVPVSSLNGQIDTLLWNNVLTLHPDKALELILRGRHYAVDNDTPSLHVDDWISLDTQFAGVARNSLPISYTKDNFSAEAKWNPVRWANLGGGWFFERWDRNFRDANITNENSGKFFVDAALFSNVLMRGSYLYGVRRYETYDTNLFVLTPALFADQFASNLRRFDLSNRNRQKADVALEFATARAVTITPSFGLLWDDYPDSVMNPLGLRSRHSWNAGVEVGAAIGPRVKLMASYNYENARLRIAGGNGNIAALTSCPNTLFIPPDLTNAFNPPECTWFGDINQSTHTLLAAANIKVVPDKFDLRLEALYTRATESSQLTPCAAGAGCDGIDGVDPATVNFGQFPPERVTFQKYSAIGRYYVDPILVRQMGWIGDVVIKARYSWMRNSTSGFTFDNMTPYWPTADTMPLEGGSRALFLAAINPNYTAQVVAMSLELKW